MIDVNFKGTSRVCVCGVCDTRTLFKTLYYITKIKEEIYNV